MRSQRLILALTVVYLASGASPALASHSYELRFGPPARAADAGVSSDTAQLQGDWHASTLSGDPDRDRSCTPESNGGQSYCSGLDWNDGVDTDGNGKPGDPGEEAYFRAWGHRDGPASSTLVKATPVAGTVGCTTYLKVKIINSVGATVGTMVYQHISPISGLGTFNVKVGAAVFNSRVIGRMVEDGSACWEGYHVHEDDDTAASWYAWNTTKYTGSQLSRFQVDNPNNWTRQIRWTVGCHTCV